MQHSTACAAAPACAAAGPPRRTWREARAARPWRRALEGAARQNRRALPAGEPCGLLRLLPRVVVPAVRVGLVAVRVLVVGVRVVVVHARAAGPGVGGGVVRHASAIACGGRAGDACTGGQA